MVSKFLFSPRDSWHLNHEKFANIHLFYFPLHVLEESRVPMYYTATQAKEKYKLFLATNVKSHELELGVWIGYHITR